MRTLTYYVATSLDGYIADPDGGFGDFDVSPELLAFIATNYPETLPTPARDQMGIDAPNARFDTVLMGRATYEAGLPAGFTSPYAHLDQIVCSRTMKPSDGDGDGPVRVEGGSAVDLVRSLKRTDGGGIWLCGGGLLAGALADEIDELVIKRQPMLLAAGRPMIAGPSAAHRFELTDRRMVGTVCVESYRRRSAT